MKTRYIAKREPIEVPFVSVLPLFFGFIAAVSFIIQSTQ